MQKVNVVYTERILLSGLYDVGFKRKKKALRKIESAKQMEARQKQMVEERKKKVQIEEDARVAKKRKEKHIEEVRILNKGYDQLFEAKYETDTLWESTTRPPANSLRLSRFFGRTATSTKGMKKVSKKWQKLNKKKKKTLSKKRSKKAKGKRKGKKHVSRRKKKVHG